jgi:Tfp pilus assembly protein PilN
MSTSVNLVPLDCLHARVRSKRRNTWTVLTLGAGVFVLSVWLVSGTASNAVNRVGQHLGETRARQSVLDGELANANASRTALIERLGLLSGLQQEQPWAGRLAVLAARIPPGVVLTHVTAGDQVPRSPAAQPLASLVRPAAAGERDASVAAGSRQRGQSLAVQLSGVAVDHDELARLIEALRGSEGWGQVKLIRAARQPFLNGLAVGFQLQCERRGPTP